MSDAPGASPAPRTGFFSAAGLAAILGASLLAATGRFEAAAALTLGAAVAIVGAFWLADLVRRFGARGASPASGITWKFAATGLLRYGLAGLALWWAVETFPREIPWLLAGTSVVLVGAAWQAATEREEKPGAEGEGRQD
ncbi:MAG: hypothetical protein ACHQPI_12375 [Thermoanaerobaculia bacterium]